MSRNCMRRFGVGLAASLALLAAACREAPDPPIMPDSVFVSAMVELMSLTNEPGADTAAMAATRRDALERRGITAEQLEQMAAQLAERPGRASAVWRQIRVRAGG